MTLAKRPLTSARVQAIPSSGIRRFFDLIASTEGAISLGVGEPDFVTPDHIREAAIKSIRDGETHYTSNYGILRLRERIAAHTLARRGVTYDPAREVLVTVGVSEAVDLAFRATIDHGDEVVVADPSYVAYVPAVILAGGTPVPVAADASTGFRLLPAAVAAALTPRTRGILLGFPNNPTGGVLEAEDLAGIAALAREHDLLVYADEIYDRLVNGTAHRSILDEPGMRERTVYLNGFSKAYAMTGWRVGYACAPAAIIEQMMKIHQYTVMSASTVAQYAAIEALEHGEPDVVRMVAEYDRRRKLVWSRFNAMGLPCHEPQGAFYCFPDVRGTGLDDEAFSERLLKEEKVVLVPGSAFGARGAGHVRACYATSYEKLEEACDRIARFVGRL
ncbi:MAG: aminotransferase class I/II-fold pyridoxal phosphate-dependent enzyme [Candidatus Limnocylindria bacterium]|nr:aminotransferase class I/II-fold pyridoxal phosphate-dependent enzyme [Candidatus Limnocylindria bacterium]